MPIYTYINDFCPTCHKPGTYIGDIPDGADPGDYVCMCHQNEPVTLVNPWFMQDKGWFCPRCGKVNAPWAAACDCQPVKTNRNTINDPFISDQGNG